MGMLAGAPVDSRFKSLQIDCVVSKQIVWSAANVCMGMGMLAGAPVGGRLHDTYNSYPPLFIFLAVFILLTSILIFLAYNLHNAEAKPTKSSKLVVVVVVVVVAAVAVVVVVVAVAVVVKSNV